MVQAVTDALVRYAKRVRSTLGGGPTNPELALAPSFKSLVDELLPLVSSGSGLVTVPEYAKKDVGRPDLALVRTGQPPRAFIELKAPEKPADPERWKDAHDKRQFGRFSELPTWALSNFNLIRLYRRGELEMETAVVPARALKADTGDAKAASLIAAHDPDELLELLGKLAIAQPPSAANAKELAGHLAHAARLVRASVLEHLDAMAKAKQKGRPLQLVRDEFREVLYAHPEAGGYRGEFDTLFSAAFAQTLAFGLLLVREATGHPVDANAWQQMPDEHPLMKTALRVLSEPEIVEQIGLGFDILFDTINSFDLAILAQRPGKGDPILYFYEDFVSVFDRQARERYGVYYTPVEVVRYMVGALDRALREDLGTAGLRDEAVTLLDPAVGTGTFLLGIAERVRADVTASAGAGTAALALRQLATRMFGFELLIGPYAVAHYRLHHALAAPPSPSGEGLGVGKVVAAPKLPRLGIYLADTLAEPGTSAPMGKLGYTADPIRLEREEADRIKGKQEILAIIGNPPYWRFQDVNPRDLVGPFVDRLWDDLKKPVRDAGWANQLNTFPEFSIAFWRWSIWKLFEADNAPRRGVIAFISNRTFLAGKPYAGLRKMLRERFDRIEVIDLRGDVRRGARAGVVGDEGVFNIMVGTAITIAVADGSKAEGALADILYTDSWERDLFSRQAKLDWLDEGTGKGTRPGAISIERALLDAFRPLPFQSQQAPSLSECFRYASSGVQTKRDSFVYAVAKEALINRIVEFKGAAGNDGKDMFRATDARPWDIAQAQPLQKDKAILAAYRALDIRHLYNVESFLDRPRPALQQVWGASNIALYAMPFATGAGPALWCHALLPDYHAFSGRGGYAFPLYDRRAGHGPLNVSPALLAGLALAYAGPISAEDAFDAMLALLSATSYTLRFAEDLEDVFPHVPFPATRAVFDRAAAVGREIRAVETFARPPGPAFLTPGLASVGDHPTGVLGVTGGGTDDMRLCANGSGKVTGMPSAVWDFAVSGYRVLPRWLAARAGQPVDLAFINEFRDITGRINELIHRFAEADLVLEQALTHSLTRDQLGLAHA